MNDVNQLRDVAVTAFLPLVADALVLCGMIGVMIWLDWKLTALALLMLPLFWLWTVRLTRRIQKSAQINGRGNRPWPPPRPKPLEPSR